MVLLIPSDRNSEEFNGSLGEEELYNRFNELSDDYIVFHSVRWNENKRKYWIFGEADYIVFHKKFGVLCLEVKSGGMTSRHGRLYQINRKTLEEKEITPMEQAEKSKYFFRSVLSKKIERFNVKIPIYSMVWLTDANKSDLEGALPSEYQPGSNVFFHDDMSKVEQTFDKCFAAYHVSSIEYPKQVVKEVIDAIAPTFNIFPSASTLMEQNQYHFNRMTEQQTYLLDYLDEQKEAAIQGGAGTGKTILGIEKARRLSKEEKVVFLCYNRFLADSLRERYSEELPNVTFTTLLSMVTKALKRKVEDEDVHDFLNNYDAYPSDWYYKSVIVDEGQDFTDESLMSMKTIASLNDGSFYVFYDRNQLVQRKTDLQWLYEMDCQLVLSINCRNTLSIAETSSNPIGVSKIKMRTTIEGRVPEYFNANSKEDLIIWLENRIKYYTSQGIMKKEIVILTTKTENKSILSDVRKIGSYTLINEQDNKNILFTSARKFKGLESHVVILIDIDSELFETKESRRVFYVAASRAKSYLDLTSVLTKEEQKNMFSKISNGRNTRKSVLLNDLKVNLI